MFINKLLPSDCLTRLVCNDLTLIFLLNFLNFCYYVHLFSSTGNLNMWYCHHVVAFENFYISIYSETSRVIETILSKNIIADGLVQCSCVFAVKNLPLKQE